MKSFILQNKFFLLLILIFIISECIVNPIGNFPLIDDWCYAQIVLYFDKEGSINLGNFPAMTLYTHVLWGYFFTHLFGFSFMVLRISSFISAIAGFWFLNKLVLQISGNKIVAFMSCLIIMFHPLAFSLTNTFMTDVNFNTLVIICCYLLYNYFRTAHIAYYVFFSLCSVAITLTRQYGIVFPVCFVFASFFMREKRILNLILAIVTFIITYTLLKVYEHHLAAVIPSGSTYKFSENIHITSRVFWETFYETFLLRYKDIVIDMLVYTMPLAIIFLASLIKQSHIKLTVFIFVVSAIFVYFLFNNFCLSCSSISATMTVLPESFCESFKGARHYKTESYGVFFFWVKWVSAFVTLFVFILAMVWLFLKSKSKHLLSADCVFFIAFIFGYSFMTLITESNFDRYYIPLITVSLLLFAYLTKFNSLKIWPAIIPLMLWSYVSIFGTKDYMELNRQKWEAYWYLRQELKIPKEKINGGFEVNCWNEGEGMGWRDFLNMDNFDYLIQFNPEPNFKALKEFEFQHYFPYKKDKIYIFVREHEK